jgi:hypothetical protein
MLQEVVVDWDGASLPAELRALLPAGLRDLPPGRYVVEPLVDDDELTPEEEAGILEALAEVEAGHVIPWEEALRQIRSEAAATTTAVDPEPASEYADIPSSRESGDSR